ncbi:MAG: serine hydrolase domain-containing protein [Pseudomonadota bacterium]
MVKSRLLTVKPLCLLLFLGSCAIFERFPAIDIETDIQEIGAAVIERPLLHSASIGVVYKGRSFIHHAGELEAGQANPPTDETIYEIGSLSKTLAGTLIANAVLQGELSLDDPVHEYLGEGYDGLGFDGAPVRVRHLLTHTGGLPNMLPDKASKILERFPDHETPADLNEVYKDYGKAEFMADLRAVTIEAEPGASYSYSSVGTELSAHILESIYNTEYETLLTEFFAQSANMSDLTIQLRQDDQKQLAIGYHSDNPAPTIPMPKLPWGAAGNAKATVPDMIRFIEYQLASGDVVREARRPLVDFDDFSAGYFWNIIKDDKQKGTYYAHHGGVPRSQCYIYIVPKHDLGIFIITNQSGEDTADELEWALDEIVKGVEAREAQATAKTQ